MQRDYLPALVLTRSPDDAETLNRALRGAGHAVRPTWIDGFESLEKSLRKQEPDLIVAYTKGAGAGIAKVVELRDELAPLIPVIAISDEASEDAAAKAIQNGARDLVSLDQTERLIAVVTRELEVLRQARALQAAREKIREYEERFEGFIDKSEDALAYIQEGIHVDANPAYLSLFGYESEDEMEGLPVMDLFAGDSQKTIKKLIRDQLKGKASDEAVTLTGRRADGEEFELTLETRSLEIDGEPALELAIRSEGGASTEEYERQLEELERRDSLTGLFNRNYFGQVLTQRFQARQTDDESRALVCIQPDRFPEIQKKMGAVASDEVLKKFAAIIRERADEQDICGRFDHSMMTVLTQRSNLSLVKQWAEELRDKIASEVFEAGGQSTALTCSIGIAEMSELAETPDDLLAQAQEATQQAGKDGGNRVSRYEPPETDEEGQLSDHAWVKRIKAGVEKDLFQIVSQPIADLGGADPTLYDILVQLRDEDGKEYPASEFLPAAERNRLMALIDRWVVDNALNHLAELNDQSTFFIRLSRQTLGDDQLMQWIEKKISGGKFAPERVVFEISETTVDQRLKETKNFASKVREQGCGIAIEHFGLGNNPTQTLQHLEMDYLKIDSSFMEDIESDEDRQNLVQEYVSTAGKRGIATVAEGVEDAHTMAALFHIGITYIQGNYVQEPEVVMAEPE